MNESSHQNYRRNRGDEASSSRGSRYYSHRESRHSNEERINVPLGVSYSLRKVLRVLENRGRPTGKTRVGICRCGSIPL